MSRAINFAAAFAAAVVALGILASLAVRMLKSMLWHAIVAHKAAAEAGDFEPEPHDLALWAHVEDM